MRSAAPGPAALGRGVIVNHGAAIPAAWTGAPVVVVDEAALGTPEATVIALHEAWVARTPVAVALAVDPARFRQPQSFPVEPWRVDAASEPWFDRLHFLVWNNNYDARTGESVWWWAVKAARLDPTAIDGERVWVDGGPRQTWAGGAVDGLPVISYETIDGGRADTIPAAVAPQAELADDQLAAVAHARGPARVIAPAGSGKTRVLTERLRHLHVDRGYERAGVVAVAYNKQAQLELQGRTASFGPRVRTLNSLGLWVLSEHRGRAPALVDEREVRRMVDSMLPGRRQRRSNTDPIGPYLEGLTSIRLGLQDPQVVEESRDDVPGIAELFPLFRAELAERGAIDFDEQIYSAVAALLADGEFRRRVQPSCRHVLVDEFQDLTPAHVLLLRLLALPELDVFGVGDDDQCIYGHAGADPRFLIDYGRFFTGAAAHPLQVNYRCPSVVVGAAATLLGYNRRRVDKQIVAGPGNDPAVDALRVVEHRPDDAATSAVEVVQQWLTDGRAPGSMAVLTRVNSLLLAPHVALHQAGVPVNSVLSADVLNRTGLRAALAYLRIAVAGDAIDPDDIVEILRRPTRGLPQWFPDRLRRRSRWSVKQLRGIGNYVDDKEVSKVERLADDLELVVAAGRGTTRQILEVVRDDIGLGSAMSMLDRTGGGQGSSHLDDLDGLLAVADLHPDAAGFEAWVRAALEAPATRQTRGRGAQAVPDEPLFDDGDPGPWALEQAVPVAPDDAWRDEPADGSDAPSSAGAQSPEGATSSAGTSDHAAAPAPAGSGSPGDDEPPAPQAVTLSTIHRVKGREWDNVLVYGVVDGVLPHRLSDDVEEERRVLHVAVTRARRQAVVLTDRTRRSPFLDELAGIAKAPLTRSTPTLELRSPATATRRSPNEPLAPLEGLAAVVETALREWRTARARADSVPPYIVLNDRHLRSIAAAMPTSPQELLRCDGIGPTKLDRYGDQIVDVITTATHTGTG